MALSFVTGCGGSASPPTAGSTPFVYFPQQDTTMTGASAGMQRLWGAYQVSTIPGVHTVEKLPAMPPLANLTNGVVPPDEAAQWETGFIRSFAWQQWALAHGQVDFVGHLNKSEGVGVGLSEGATVAVPNCASFPTQLTLAPSTATGSLAFGIGVQYEFIATYAGPCSEVEDLPDGSTRELNSFGATDIQVHLGWYHEDPVLGGLWIDEQLLDCQQSCPTVNAQAAPAPPTPLAADTPFASAPPALQAVWLPYEVKTIPRGAVVLDLPTPPRVSNQTSGAVSDATAQRWATAVYQDGAWEKWMWEHDQIAFQPHIGSQSAYESNPLNSIELQGGIPAIPNCAVYPTAMKLTVITADDLNSAGRDAAIHDEFKFELTYPSSCKVTVTYPDGRTDTADLSSRADIVSYGSVRDDPFLGSIWYSDRSVTPTGL